MVEDGADAPHALHVEAAAARELHVGDQRDDHAGDDHRVHAEDEQPEERRSSLAPFEERGGEQEEHDGEEDRHAELADAVAPELAVRDGEEREEAEQEERERRPGAGLA